eukprot:COSAG01_NODE_23_length_37704_cov_30.005877_8_plen_82_part_00
MGSVDGAPITRPRTFSTIRTESVTEIPLRSCFLLLASSVRIMQYGAGGRSFEAVGLPSDAEKRLRVRKSLIFPLRFRRLLS